MKKIKNDYSAPPASRYIRIPQSAAMDGGARELAHGCAFERKECECNGWRKRGAE